ncbi:hypothetical protein DOTSEDRAFT_43760 [Dothistroma septosporum NZE10]|uniref:Palmitoyltransferase n=1 Tax=Dothistroma septosporum (strain NZE10 / CBS 128990) TaxID=675120 RepID=N1PR45_DOTSN|nr:hypothetical protein DOTSEDRAFT_43760 [Dothistroma septosporum NZE10]
MPTVGLPGRARHRTRILLDRATQRHDCRFFALRHSCILLVSADSSLTITHCTRHRNSANPFSVHPHERPFHDAFDTPIIGHAMPSTAFSDMPTLAAPTSTPSPPFHRRRKSWARKLERCCCQTFAYFPLTFVYGLTTWAVYVEVDVSFLGIHTGWAYFRAGLGIVLYALANISYTIAVFTSPGSPSDPRQDASCTGRKAGGYEDLPTYEDGEDAADGLVPDQWMTTVTAKSTGQPRYCKKCSNVKPDRTHHCSTCGRCVLKMDHHCPWLATCVGLRNYKAFILFLTYTSLFCWVSFAVAATWVWAEIIDGSQMEEGLRVVNVILLSVLAGIIGLVLSGFTAWHIYLCLTNQTTIESLEKTRYLSPLKKSMEHQFQKHRNYLGSNAHTATVIAVDADQSLGDRLKEIHANALPGVLRPEEGDTSLNPSRDPSPIPSAAAASPAHQSLRHSYASLEAQRERDRYNSYLDEQDSQKLPNAFDLGWKRNLRHVLGDEPLCWVLPICNTSGNGWQWEVSPRWCEARDRIASERERRAREEAYWGQGAPTQHSFEPPPGDLRWTPGRGFVDRGRHIPNGSREARSSPLEHVSGGTSMQLQPLDRRKPSSSLDVDDYDTSSDEEARQQKASGVQRQGSAKANWNDIPEDFLDPKADQGRRSRSQGRAKGISILQ